ncbi:hypothetical protein Tco_0896904 [Tanacetum coccineum]
MQLPIAKFALEVEHIGSSSRPQLTDIVIDITPLEELPNDPSFTTPKDNRGKGIATDTDESLCNLVPASNEVRSDPDTLVAAQEAKLIELNNHALIKVVEEVVSEAGVDPNALRNKKGGQEFIKQQDAELKVHQREDLAKDELSVIIPKKKNKVVGELMTPLSKKKRKALELEPEVRIVGLECNRSLPERILFLNNKVIKTPKHEIFFTDAFEEHAFRGTLHEQSFSESPSSAQPESMRKTQPFSKELDELLEISDMIDSRLENIDHDLIVFPPPASPEQLLHNFLDPPKFLKVDDIVADAEFVDTLLVSPFLDLDDESDDGEVVNDIYLNEEYFNRKISRFSERDLAFPCMIGFRKFVAYFDPNLSINIITRKAINTIMVNQLASRNDNFVAIVRNVQVFVGSFTYTTDFTVFEDIENYIEIGSSEVVMGKPFKDLTHLEDDCSKGLISFTRLWDTYIFQKASHGT